MRPSASGFGFGGSGRLRGCAAQCGEGNAARWVIRIFRADIGDVGRDIEIRAGACAGEAAQAVVSLRDVELEDLGQAGSLCDGDFEEAEREVTSSSSSFSASSSDSSSLSESSSSGSSSFVFRAFDGLRGCFRAAVASLRGA